MSTASTEPTFVAVNASVLTVSVATVPPPVFVESGPAFVAPSAIAKKRNINDGRKWLAALLLITAAGGATAVVFNPALRSNTLAWSSLSTVSGGPVVAAAPISTQAEPELPLPAVKTVAADASSPPVDNPRPSPSDNAPLLWEYALNAESHRDFATAVKLYERLESLPNTQWPAGLHVRLQLARQELVSGLR